MEINYLMSGEATSSKKYTCLRETNSAVLTSKFVELISPVAQVLLIDGKCRNLVKGVCELYISAFLRYVLQV